MKEEVIILIAEDDEGHQGLITRNLARAGITNEVMLFQDGEQILNFLLEKGEGPHREPNRPYLLLLDIRMPKRDGIEVLRQMRAVSALGRIPVIMITTTADPREVELCHDMGCNNYITKPVAYDDFVAAIRNLGLFLKIVQVPAADIER